MEKISFSCMCAANAVYACPTFTTLIIPALNLGFSRSEAEHLYDCCCAIYRNSRDTSANR